MKTLLLSLALVAPTFAALPAVGPDYARPVVVSPTAYRDDSGGSLDPIAGEWWRAFNDPALDDLVFRAFTTNPDLQGALARVEQARALAGTARSTYLPDLTLRSAHDRSESSRTVDNAVPVTTTTHHRLALDLGWELDLFGRVRRLNEGARADLDAAGATFAGIRLALAAEVATVHFTLQSLDREIAVVTNTVRVRREALDLVDSRFRRGTADDLDRARAETELATTEVDAAELAIRRAAAQNALAVLLGESAPAVTLPVSTIPPASIPVVPVGLPGDLLTRRPDIAAAERSLAAASARIGVAQAAFFPAISLTGGAGFASADFNDLTKSDSRLWSFGPSVYLPLFQGGRNTSNLARSRAVYDEAAANYRQRVLDALREVQDAITATRLLADQVEAQDRALASARRGAELSQKRYDAGLVSYFEVVDAQRTVLAVERAAAQLAGRRLVTSVALIKALGGGWQAPAS